MWSCQSETQSTNSVTPTRMRILGLCCILIRWLSLSLGLVKAHSFRNLKVTNVFFFIEKYWIFAYKFHKDISYLEVFYTSFCWWLRPRWVDYIFHHTPMFFYNDGRFYNLPFMKSLSSLYTNNSVYIRTVLFWKIFSCITSLWFSNIISVELKLI